MKVLYDFQTYQIQTHGGISMSFTEVISRLSKFGVKWDIAIKDSKNIYLREMLPNVNISDGFETRSTFSRRYSFKGRGKLYDLLSDLRLIHNSDTINKKETFKKIVNSDFDIFHPTFYDTYFLKYLDLFAHRPIVATIHDMTSELFSEQFSSIHLVGKKAFVKYADGIIVPSQNTKDDLVRMTDICEDKVRVIRHGSNEIDDSYYDSLKRVVQGKYLLFVGTRSGFKGFNIFLKSFAKIVAAKPDLQLVCTSSPFNKEELNLLSQLGIYNNVHQMFVDQKTLHSLYKYAEAFVFPSLYEGFGLPIYEAFSLRCPVYLNNTSCFPEIAEDAGIFFEQDYEHSNFHDVYLDTIDKGKLINDKINKGLALVKRNTWDQTAMQYVSFYKELIDKKENNI